MNRAFASIFGLAGLWLAAGAAAASERMAVLPVQVSGGVTAARAALEAAVVTGVEALEWPLVRPDERDKRLADTNVKLPCTTPACWAALGRAVDATYFVSMALEKKAGHFVARGKVYRADSGGALGTHEERCPAADCSIAELARSTTRELIRQTLGRYRAAEAAPAPVASPPPVVVPLPVPAPVAPVPPDAPAQNRSLVVPVALGVAGVAAVVGGIYLISIDGKCAAKFPDGTACKDRFSNLLPGIPTLVLGVGAVAVSAVWLWRDAHADVALAVSPGGAALLGRF